MAKQKKTSYIDDYVEEYNGWHDKLKPIWTDRFDRNYRQYTAYTEVEGTDSKISDPVAPELTERQIRRLFEKDPLFFALGRGKNVPKEVTDLMGDIVSFYWTNPDMVASTGTMKSKLKVGGREFCILGNVVFETYYNSDSESPDIRVHKLDNVVFNPAQGLKSSKIKYVRQTVDLKYLEENEEVVKDGVTKGLYKNLNKVKEQFKDATVKNSHGVTVNRSAESQTDYEDPIELISRYKGAKVCRFIKNASDDDGAIIIQEFESVLGESPLACAMDVEIVGQPYAMSYLDFINGLTQAKDLTLNQIVSYGAKSLNSPLFYDPLSAPINKLLLANAYKLGGLVPINPAMADHKPMPPINNVGFQLLDYIQQRSESVVGSSAYTDGTTNTASDKTKGTLGGIQQLTTNAQGPIKDRQLNLEESIIEPIVNKWLKMASALMSENEVKYAFIGGTKPKWVEFTKGLLSGKITLKDMLVSELMTEDEVMELSAILQAEGKDPNTELIFDVDWIIRCESGSMAEVDKKQELENFQAWVVFNQSIGRQQDLVKLSNKMAQIIDIKEPEQYDIEQPSMMASNGVTNEQTGSGQPGQDTGASGAGTPPAPVGPPQAPQQVGGLPMLQGQRG